MKKFSQDELGTIQASAKSLEASQVFRSSNRLLRFIHYLVDATLKGTENKLNQTAIGIDVFDRDAKFDPTVDSAVRVEAGRLRNKLREYYETEGANDPVRFELPKGNYGLKVHFNNSANAVQLKPEETTQAAQNVTKQSLAIAVLPFDPLSNNAGDGELADAVTIAIIDQLGRSTIFDSVSRRSSFAYKGKYEDVRDIAEALKVNHILEGSLRRSGDHLRFSVALIDGSDGRQVWSDLYEFEESEQLNLETHIAQQIVASLVCFSWKITADNATKNQSDLAINNQSLKLIFHFSKHNCQLGKKHALEAIEQQPNLAESYGVLAFHSMQEYINCWSENPEQTRLEGIAAANRAIELGSRNYWAQWGAAVAFEWLGEPLRALPIMESARILHPDDFLVMGFYGHTLLHNERIEEGLQAIQQAIDSGPADRFMPPFYIFSCIGHSLLGHWEEAALAGGKACYSMMNGSATNALFYSNALAQVGRTDEANAMLAEARRLSTAMTLPFFEKVCQCALANPATAGSLSVGLKQLDWE
jgi:TolB-like protein